MFFNTTCNNPPICDTKKSIIFKLFSILHNINDIQRHFFEENFKTFDSPSYFFDLSIENTNLRCLNGSHL